MTEKGEFEASGCSPVSVPYSAGGWSCCKETFRLVPGGVIKPWDAGAGGADAAWRCVWTAGVGFGMLEGLGRVEGFGFERGQSSKVDWGGEK